MATEYRFYCFKPSQHDLFALRSSDLNTWVNFGVRFTPIAGTTVRDPSVIKIGSTYWLVNTSAPAVNEFSSVNFFSLSSSTDDGVTFTNPAQISCSSVAGSGAGARCWAPTWFQDDDGSVHVVVTISTDAINFSLYILAFNSGTGTFGAPTQITGTSFPADMIDGFLVSPANSPNGKYNLFYKNDTTTFVEYASSSSRASGYTLTKTGNWAGWGSPLESPNLQKLPNGNWRIWLDADGGGYSTSDSSDGWATWSTKTAILSPFVPQHGSIISQSVASLSASVSQRSIINVNLYDSHFTYAFINHVLNGGLIAPIGTFTGGSWPTLIDRTTGFANNAAASGQNWGVSVAIPKSSDFHGPWVLTWDGDGRALANFPGSTWTEVNLATASSTITSGNVDIPTGTQNYVAGMKITFGTTRGTIIAGTTYYVSSSGLTTTNIRVSSSYANAIAGTNITPSGGTGASTITPKGQGSYSRAANGDWTKTAGNGLPSYIVFNGGAADFTQPRLASNTQVIVKATGGSDGFVRNVRWYRLEDEEDLLAGKIYRTPFKQELVSHNPSAIRFMNWTGGNADINCRWENRLPPTMGTYSGSFGVGPTYLTSTAAVANQFTVASASGMPVSMQHGETATFDNIATARATNGFRSVTGITNANPAVVSLTAHGYLVGDWVIHKTSGGMPNLNLWPVQITAVTANTYSFANPAGAGLGTFSSAQVLTYITLNIGGRGAYPILFSGGAYAANFGTADNFVLGTKTFHFDKNIIGNFDGSGNPVYGAWLMNDTNQVVGTINGVPAEICVAMVNEINALSVSQGITNPVHIWLNLPYRGLLSIDPDYSSGSNWAVNLVTTVLNGTTALTPVADLFLEYSNEIWNDFTSTAPGAYLQQYGAGRWYPTAYPASGNFVDPHALRATCMSRDIKAAFPNNTRIHTVIGCQGAGGFAPSSQNFLTCYGDPTTGNAGNLYYTDSTVVGGNWNTPISNVNALCIAPYLDASGTYWGTTTGTGTLTDDSALYNGTNNTINGGGNYTGAANPTLAITHFVTAVGNYTGDGGTGSLDYTQTGGWLDQFSQQLSVGKFVLHYEGGQDWPESNSANGGVWNGHTITSADDAFLTGVTNSSQWATAQTNFFTAYMTSRPNCRMPALYTWENVNTIGDVGNAAWRWSYATPDAYASGIEGQGLLNNPTWAALSLRNLGLSELVSITSFGFSVIHGHARRHTKMIGY